MVKEHSISMWGDQFCPSATTFSGPFHNKAIRARGLAISMREMQARGQIKSVFVIFPETFGCDFTSPLGTYTWKK